MLTFSQVVLMPARVNHTPLGDAFAVDVQKLTGIAENPFALVATFHALNIAEATEVAQTFINALPKK